MCVVGLQPEVCVVGLRIMVCCGITDYGVRLRRVYDVSYTDEQSWNGCAVL